MKKNKYLQAICICGLCSGEKASGYIDNLSLVKAEVSFLPRPASLDHSNFSWGCRLRSSVNWSHCAGLMVKGAALVHAVWVTRWKQKKVWVFKFGSYIDSVVWHLQGQWLVIYLVIRCLRYIRRLINLGFWLFFLNFYTRTRTGPRKKTKYVVNKEKKSDRFWMCL